MSDLPPVVLWLHPLNTQDERGSDFFPSCDFLGEPAPADRLLKKMRALGFNDIRAFNDVIVPHGSGEDVISAALEKGERFARANGIPFFHAIRPTTTTAEENCRFLSDILNGLPGDDETLFLLVGVRGLFFSERDLVNLVETLRNSRALRTYPESMSSFEVSYVVAARKKFFRVGAKQHVLPAESTLRVDRDRSGPRPDAFVRFEFRSEYNCVLDALPRQKVHLSYEDLNALWTADPTLFFPVPHHVSVEITNQDNLPRLRSAQALSKRPVGWMSHQHLDTLVESLPFGAADAPCHVDLWDFGEPLCHNETISFIERIARKGVRIDLYTNGLLLDEPHAARLLDSGVDAIFYRLDAASADVYERVSGNRDFFGVALKNLDALIRLRKHRGGSMIPWKPELAVQITEMPETREDISAFLERYDIAGKAAVSITSKTGRAPDPVQLYGEIYKSSTPIDHAMIRHDNLFRGRVKRTDGADYSPLHRFPCRQVLAGPHILWNGSIVPCREDIDGEEVMGQLEDGLLKVWKSDPMRQFIARHCRGAWSESPFCSSCKEWYYCHD
jgi:radical SAM protein with 4Fe4S-binding SPASM domain